MAPGLRKRAGGGTMLCSWGWRRTFVLLIPLLAMLLSAGPARARRVPPAQEDTLSASGTNAWWGAAIGAATGGVLGGLAVGALSAGLCDSGNCGGAFGEGFLFGLVYGSVVGGFTGLVIGSAIPREREEEARRPGPEPERREEGASRGGDLRAWTLTGGGRWVGSGRLRGGSYALGLATTSATSRSVDFGFETVFLGHGEDTHIQVFQSHSGSGEVGVRDRFESWIFGINLLASRGLGAGAEWRPYLEGSAGIYPVREKFETEELTGSGVDGGFVGPYRESSWSVYPGLGVGGAVARREGSGGLSLMLRSRLHLILGGGSEAVLPVVSVGLGVRWVGG